MCMNERVRRQNDLNGEKTIIMEEKKESVIRVKNLYKIYQVGTNKVYALNGVDFTMYKGEFCAIVGPSGSGKSTLLNMLAGLEKPTRGEIIIAGKHMERMNENQLVQFRRENVGFIFQSYNLLKTLNAVENVALPLSFRGVPKKIRNAKAEEYLKLVGLEKQMKHMANAMSGGQQQRVGIARAFAANPPIVLMDEPFSALDPMTRAELQNEIHDLQTKAQKTVVFVTHDMDEAIKLADRICIIQDGKVAQCDTPENILKHPANQYVTEFIGANRLWANPEYIRAADIMRRRPFTISKGRTVIQALQIMRHNSVDSLLVLDKGQTLLGVVWLEELIGKREADPIEYYISDDYIAVEGETSLKEIIATIDYDVSGIIPVIQHDRKLLGYLTKSIILATMSKQFVPEHTAGERSGVICPATL